MLPFVHTFANGLFETIRALLGPFGFIISTLLLAMIGWSLWSAVRDSVSVAQRMHEIPCANCQFYTGDYRLKCPVHPMEAASESAINCKDYHPSRSL